MCCFAFPSWAVYATCSCAGLCTRRTRSGEKYLSFRWQVEADLVVELPGRQRHWVQSPRRWDGTRHQEMDSHVKNSCGLFLFNRKSENSQVTQIRWKWTDRAKGEAMRFKRHKNVNAHQQFFFSLHIKWDANLHLKFTKQETFGATTNVAKEKQWRQLHSQAMMSWWCLD